MEYRVPHTTRFHKVIFLKLGKKKTTGQSLMTTQTDHERVVQEQRRLMMSEKNEFATKMNKLEYEHANMQSTVNSLKEQQAQHNRECPLKDSSTATLLTEEED